MEYICVEVRRVLSITVSYWEWLFAFVFTAAEKVGLFTTIVHKRNTLLERISHLGINYEALWAQ